ncbi:MAG: SRPBCC family protein [Deltaproteobacteria bacterium]|nr:SRPBCC family protein [Deltaproteobacteria bacterium]
MSTSSTDRIEQQMEMRAPLARVWQALTDHQQFGTWFRVQLEAPFVVGQPTQGRITYPGYEHVVMRVVVQAIEPQHRFAFTWHPYAVDPTVDYASEPMTLVEFRLQPTRSGTRVSVTESGFDALPPGRRAEAYRMNSDGWSGQMQNIAAYVQA